MRYFGSDIWGIEIPEYPFLDIFSNTMFRGLCAKYDNYEHQPQNVNAVKTTCTVHGHSDYTTYKHCNKTLSEYTEYPLAEHKTYASTVRKAPTCTESGYTETIKCSVCKQTIQESTVIPALGHSPVVVPAVSATETETGLTEGVKCSRCGI